MGNRIRKISLALLCLAAVHLVGCFPDNSLEWSDDGSFGLLCVEGSLFLVDSRDGELTLVEPEGVSLMPDISADGARLVYAKGFPCAGVEEGLALFPRTVAGMVRHDAQQLEQKILAGLIAPGDLPTDKEGKLGYTELYLRWVVRCLCDRPTRALTEKLGQDTLAACQGREIGFIRLVVANRADLGRKKTLMTLPVGMSRPRFSPDGRHVAYMTPAPHDEEKGILLMASAEGTFAAMEVAKNVALGYDWRPDSKALAYVKQDGDPILGALEEKVVVGDDGAPLMKPLDEGRTDSVSTSEATQPGRQFVGTLFQPAMHVAYGLDGRILLSSLLVLEQFQHKTKR